MGTITTTDGTEIFYKDWGAGSPVVFKPRLAADRRAWDDQLFFLASQGYRAIAHDRRGGRRPGQAWNGTTWIPTPTTSPTSSRPSTCVTRSGC